MFISIGTCYSTYMTFCCIFSLSLIWSWCGFRFMLLRDFTTKHQIRCTLAQCISELWMTSNIDDSMCAHSVHMNRTVSEMVPNGDYKDIVRELVSAFVGVASRQQFLQPIYNPTEESGSHNQAFSSSHGDISSY
jgi:hypothetical protein